MLASRTVTVALVGNPNTGKTTLFNALCGMNQRVGNYPGVTVETKKGKCQVGDLAIDVIDLPGTYSLAPRSPDEMVAVEVVLGKTADARPDVIVAIIDASNIQRNLYLATQAMELGIPLVIALNMIDVAKDQGHTLDLKKLESNLGVPVVPIQANQGKGLDELKVAIAGAAQSQAIPQGPKFPEAFEREVERLAELPAFLARRLLLDVGGQMEKNWQGDDLAAARGRLAAAGCAVPAIEARTRYAWIHKATDGCIVRPKQRIVSWTDRIDKILTHRTYGTLVFLFVMFAVFVSIFVAAAPAMDFLTDGLDSFGKWVKAQMDPGPLRSLIVSGIIAGVGSVVVFLPQIFILFAFIAVLEDCGYMARAAYLMDRLMSRAGLNGKSFIPLLSSVACAVPGIMAARVIENRRDRLATILVAPLMSCSARIPVYMLFIGALFTTGYPFWFPGFLMFAMYMIGFLLAPVVAYCLKSTALRGETPAFVLEMPLYKRPSLMLVLRRAFDAGWMFLRRAGTIILASMILIWALQYFPTTGADGKDYEAEFAQRETEIETLEDGLKEKGVELENAKELAEKRKEDPTIDADVTSLEGKQDEQNALKQTWQNQSYLARMGKSIEPIVEPLGWDWRIGTAAIASFPAREVIVGTFGLIFGQGEVDAGEEEPRQKLGEKMAEVRWNDDPEGPLLFTMPVALGVMVFFALCAQCVSTLAVIKRETNSWGWPIFSFVYMTVLAYLGALAVYQIGSRFL